MIDPNDEPGILTYEPDIPIDPHNESGHCLPENHESHQSPSHSEHSSRNTGHTGLCFSIFNTAIYAFIALDLPN